MVADSPAIWMPPAPAIIRPADSLLLRPLFWPGSPEERREALREMVQSGRINQGQAEQALVFFAPVFFGKADGPQIQRINSYASGTDATSYTISIASGTAVPAGRVLLLCYAGYSATNRTFSNLTLGGVATTAVCAVQSWNPTGANQNTLLNAGIRRITTTAGGTLSLVASFSGGMTRFLVDILEITGYRSDVPYDAEIIAGAQTGTSFSIAQALDISGNGVTVGFAPYIQREATAPSTLSDTVWSKLTARFMTARNDGGVLHGSSVAFDALSSPALGVSIGFNTPSCGMNNVALAVASFR